MVGTQSIPIEQISTERFLFATHSDQQFHTFSSYDPCKSCRERACSQYRYLRVEELKEVKLSKTAQRAGDGCGYATGTVLVPTSWPSFDLSLVNEMIVQIQSALR